MLHFQASLSKSASFNMMSTASPFSPVGSPRASRTSASSSLVMKPLLSLSHFSNVARSLASLSYKPS